MLQNYNDTRIRTKKPLISPSALATEFPLSETNAHFIEASRIAAKKIIQGHDDRLLIIVGPCSIHDIDAALEYATRLKRAAHRHRHELYIVMRTYLEKPRTTLGWRGLIHDPLLDGSCDTQLGLKLARNLLLELINREVPVATEFLDTLISCYIRDLISWSAIGARTSESQIHRELASSLPMPVGFKNSTDGNIKIAIDAVATAQHPHHFISMDEDGIPSIMHTTGNSACHIILRGSSDSANYEKHHVTNAFVQLQNQGLSPRLMIDCSHGNSMKNYQNQLIAARSVAAQISIGSTAIFGMMIESNLVEGNQPLEQREPLIYGKSITDACISWEQTETLLNELARAVQLRRQVHTQQVSVS